MTMPPFRRLVFLLVITSLIAAGAALLLGVRQPTRYQSSISFAVNRIHQGGTENYEYDGYYAIQAADLFSQTVVSWFSTPSVLLEVYERAGVSADGDSLTALTQRFKTKKYAAQNIVVTFTEESRERAEKVAAAVTETMQIRSSKLNQTADARALFEIVGSKPVVVTSAANLPALALAGALGGFLAALSLISLTAYLKSLAASERYARRD